MPANLSQDTVAKEKRKRKKRRKKKMNILWFTTTHGVGE